MARYQFEDEEPRGEWLDQTTQITQLFVRAFGFVLMVVGLWIGLKVINEAWGLYTNPGNIERFATAIERGSNLDKSLSSVNRRASGESAAQNSTAAGLAATPEVHEVNDVLGFRLSYFVAWVIAMLLLMLIGRLAIAAIKTGGELVLYDVQMKRFARLLARQGSRGTPQ